MIQESMQLYGAMTLIVHRANGEVETVHKDNIIVNVGFDFIADAIGKSVSRPNVMGFIALGTGTTAAAATQSALVTELDRNAATYAHTAGTKTFTFTADFLAGDGTGAITEAGVFNAASAGIMFDRVVFPVVNKGADDSLDDMEFSVGISHDGPGQHVRGPDPLDDPEKRALIVESVNSMSEAVLDYKNLAHIKKIVSQ